MRNPLRSIFRSRDRPQNSVSQAMIFSFGQSAAGKSSNPRAAMGMTAVYASVRVLSETVASIPLHLYRHTDQGSEKATNHPLYRLLHDEPNAEMTSFIMREAMMAHLLLWGNSYSQIIRSGRGEIVALYPLLPEFMDVDRDAGGQLTYTYYKDGVPYRLDPLEVLHIPALGFDGIMGYSPIAIERNAIGIGLAAEEYGSKFFSNGATPAGVLTHPGNIKDATKLRESWHEAYGGSVNSNRVAILEEGTKFEKISIPNNDAQFIETRKFQVDEIARIFRVPPNMIGDLEHATFSNIEQESINFTRYSVRPWLVRIEQSMNRALLTDAEKQTMYAEFNMSGLERGAYLDRMNGYAIGRQNGWLSANDIHEMENMNRIPAEQGGDLYQMNGNMVPLTGANKPAQKEGNK